MGIPGGDGTTGVGGTTTAGLILLAAALALGLLGGSVLVAGPQGVGLFFWVGALLATAALLIRRGILPPAPGASWLPLAALCFAAAAAWRDAPALRLLNLLAVLLTLALAQRYARRGGLTAAGCADYLLELLRAGAATAAGALALALVDIRWQEIPGRPWTQTALAVGRGAVLALPLLLVFTALFASADAVFSRLAADFLDLRATALARFVLRTCFWAWVAAGILRGLWGPPAAGNSPPAPAPRPAAGGARPTLGIAEVGTVLGLINALFASFVLVQLRYFFGGAELVAAATALTYAEYARRGFFELVAVTSLSLPLLLTAHWLLPGEQASQRLFRWLAGAQVVLLTTIMASALARMRLYQLEYGLTELRLYATAFMAWLALLLAWFCGTVLRGRRQGFAHGALAAGLAVLAALNVLNPDGYIVRTNTARSLAGRPLDAAYLHARSADGVPALLAVLPALPANERRLAATGLLQRWAPPPAADWRTWNWGRAQAWRLVQEQQQALAAMAGE